MAGLSLIPTGDIHNLDQEKEEEEEKNSMPHFDALTQIFVTCPVFAEVSAITLHDEGCIFCT